MGRYKKAEEKKWENAFTQRKDQIMKLKLDGYYAFQIVEKLQEPGFQPTCVYMLNNFISIYLTIGIEQSTCEDESKLGKKRIESVRFKKKP
jgi:hypothetical protein